MKKYLFSLNFSRIRKFEYPELINGVVEIVEKHNPEQLGILGMYNLLLEVQPQLNELTVSYGSHPLTAELADYRIKRLKIIRSLLAQVTAIDKAGVSALTAHTAVALPFLQRYLTKLSAKNARIISEGVNKMLAELAGDDALKAAFTALNLTVITDELKKIQQSIKQNASLRRAELAGRAKADTNNIITNVTIALDNLLIAIELAKVEHSDLDYMPLMNELNGLIGNYQVLIKSRITRSKNLAKKTTVALSPTTSATAV